MDIILHILAYCMSYKIHNNQNWDQKRLFLLFISRLLDYFYLVDPLKTPKYPKIFSDYVNCGLWNGTHSDTLNANVQNVLFLHHCAIV